MGDDVAKAVALVVGVGVAVSPLVFAGVSVTRGMIGASRQRRVILPITGIVLGCLFTALVLAVLETEPSSRNLAVVALGGFWSYAVAAGLNAQGKEARR